ncbi:MAG: hypothetical protein JW902_12635 [Syntrophaceae bacterium]|nr:hypothetical protein [Syntrophaceae bacterium]
MSGKKLYQKKMQAQLDEWKAVVDKLKIKAKRARTDIQMEMNKHIMTLERKIEEARTKLLVLAKAGEDAWGSIKEGVDAVWGSLKSAVNDAVVKFKL